jgi:hypothetical protein
MPSTSTPQDAFRRPDPGTYTCHVCIPNVHDKGGQREWMAHYTREHYHEPKPARRAS